MKKGHAVLAMVGVVVAIAGADLLILTRGGGLGRFVRAEIESRTGGVLRVRDVEVGVDGSVTLEGIQVVLGSRSLRVLDARRARLLRRGDAIERAWLEDLRLRIGDDLFEELAQKEGPTGSIRDVFPTPDHLPRVSVVGATVEIELTAVFAHRGPQAVAVRRMTVTPLDGWRIHVDAEIESAVFGRWTVDGTADLETGSYRLSCEAKDLDLRRELRDAFIPDIQDVYDKYRPEGLCDVRLVLAREPGQDVTFQAILTAKEMKFLYREFPYPVERVAGEMEFTDRGFRIKGVEGRHGPSTIRLSGWGEDYHEHAAFLLRIEIDDLVLDDAVREALKPDSRKVWDLFQPTGRAHVKGQAYRASGPGHKERIPLEIAVNGAGMRYAGFPYPAQGLSGEIFFDGDDAVIKRLRMQDGDTHLSVSGTVRDLADDPEVELVFDARAFPMDERLRDALPPAALEKWKAFSPEGPIDVRWAVSKAKGKEPQHKARARALGNAVRWTSLPVRVSDLRGEVEIDGEVVRLHHLRGKANGAEVEVHGTVDGALSLFHVDAVGMPLDDDLKKVLPDQARKVLDNLQLSGTVSFNASFKLREGGESQVDLLLKLTRGKVDAAIPIDDLEGSMDMTGFFGKETQLHGSLTLQRASIAGKRLTDVASSFNMKGAVLNFLRIKGSAYGGVVAGNLLQVDLESGAFLGDVFTLDRLDLGEFAKDTAALRKANLGGKVYAEVRDLQGKAGDASTIAASGRVRLKEGQLWDVPVFLSLVKLDPAGLFKDRAKFDAGAVDFQIRQRQFELEKIAFTSQKASLVGEGRVDFDSEISIRLTAKSGPLLGIDFFLFDTPARILDLILNPLSKVHIKGTLDDPKIDTGP